MAIPVDDELIVQVEKEIDHRMDRGIECLGVPVVVPLEASGFNDFDMLAGAIHPYGLVWVHLSDVGGW